MLSETAVIEINNILKLCETYLLTAGEIAYLNEIGADPLVTCDYYNSSQVVLTKRAKTDTSINTSLNALKVFADLDSCDITLAPEVVPAVDIPFFAGSI